MDKKKADQLLTDPLLIFYCLKFNYLSINFKALLWAILFSSSSLEVRRKTKEVSFSSSYDKTCWWFSCRTQTKRVQKTFKTSYLKISTNKNWILDSLNSLLIILCFLILILMRGLLKVFELFLNQIDEFTLVHAVRVYNS